MSVVKTALAHGASTQLMSRGANSLLAALAPGRGTLMARCEQLWLLRTRSPEEAASQARQLITECRHSKQDETIKRGLGHALACAADCAWRLGQLDRAEGLAAEALALCEEVADVSGQARALQAMGVSAFKRGRVDEGTRHVLDSLSRVKDGAAPAEEASAYNYLGGIALSASQLQLAQQMHSRALALRRQLDDHYGIALSLQNLGATSLRSGDLLQAARCLREALPIAQRLEETSLEGLILNNLGELYTATNDPEEALSVHQRSLELKERAKDREGAMLARINMGLAQIRLGRYEEARAQLERALEEGVALGVPRGEGYARMHLGQLHMESGDALPESKQLLARAAQLLSQVRDADGVSRTLNLLCELGLKAPQVFGQDRHRVYKALREMGLRAARLAEQKGFKRSATIAHRNLAALAEQTGDMGEALTHYKRYHELEDEQRGEAAQTQIKRLKLEIEAERAKMAVREHSARCERLEAALARQSAALEQMERQVEQLRELATRDELTQLLNQRALNEALAQAYERAQGQGKRLSVALFEVDGLQQINAERGYVVGDEVLRQVARVLERLARAQDRVGRWQGGAFLCILPELGLHAAEQWAERVRDTLRSLSLEGQTAQGAITLSVGISGSAESRSAEHLLERAVSARDAARGGHERIVVAR